MHILSSGATWPEAVDVLVHIKTSLVGVTKTKQHKSGSEVLTYYQYIHNLYYS